jgi:hypothetical protein
VRETHEGAGQKRFAAGKTIDRSEP